MDVARKRELMEQLAKALESAPEVRKVVVFGSFLSSPSPNDMDVAVFQESEESYLPLALKYRRIARPVSERISLDIFPVKPGATGRLIDEINEGEVVYER